MRLLFLTHKKFQTLSGKLSWSHYCELITVEDELKMRFYEHEAANSGWSVRDLRRQMNSLLFERVLAATYLVREFPNLRAEEAKAICADWRATYHERRTRPVR